MLVAVLPLPMLIAAAAALMETAVPLAVPPTVALQAAKGSDCLVSERNEKEKSVGAIGVGDTTRAATVPQSFTMPSMLVLCCTAATAAKLLLLLVPFESML